MFLLSCSSPIIFLSNFLSKTRNSFPSSWAKTYIPYRTTGCVVVLYTRSFLGWSRDFNSLSTAPKQWLPARSLRLISDSLCLLTFPNFFDFPKVLSHILKLLVCRRKSAVFFIYDFSRISKLFAYIRRICATTPNDTPSSLAGASLITHSSTSWIQRAGVH